MAIALKRAGIPFALFEKSAGVGGTWRDNSYPGAGCDVPSHLYSYSFERKADWSRHYAEQPEILRYLEECARRFAVDRHIRFGTEIESATFEEGAGRWRMTSLAGEAFDADVVVTGMGQLNRPSVPRLAGLDGFGGKAFHSARWDHGYDLAAKRVAVIGNGASAVQFVPRIAPVVDRLYLFQRSANWIVPRKDAAYSMLAKRVFRRAPALEWLHRASIYWGLEVRFLALRSGTARFIGPLVEWSAKRHLEEQVPDPVLRAKLTPDYRLGCKRILISDDYYPALTRPNVEVVVSPIARAERDGIVTVDGVRRSIDTIIFGTGFESLKFLSPLRIVGLGGRRLDDEWNDGAEAYLGTAVSGFPNFFMLYGPNTNLGHNSIVFMIESQVGWVKKCIDQLFAGSAAWLDVRRSAMDSYNRDLQVRLKDTVWQGDCHSWYKTESGRITNNWPRFTFQYWLQMRTPSLEDFRFEGSTAVDEVARRA
jgi:cation diffusion facilitator CzcD-associated flavoprotein CzcO